MFEKLGRRIDNFIYEIGCWNRRMFWFKFYAYFFLLRKKNCIKVDINKAIELFHKTGHLYDWQYKRLKKLNKNRRVAGTTSPENEN